MTRAQTARTRQPDERQGAVGVDGPSGERVGRRVFEGDVEAVGHVKESAVGLLVGG